MFDFYSDTRTKPSRTMRETVLNADVGDEQRDEDPTTSSLTRRVAEMLGKEDAVFMPSGTMCNQVSMYVLCNRGDVVICERGSHVINFEAGGASALAGAQIQALDGHRGMLSVADIDHAMKQTGKGGLHLPTAAVLALEQTANLGGGAVWPLDQLTEAAEYGRSLGLKTYLDGARLLNACVATRISADRYAAPFDVAWIDFSKGLGCPFGAVLAGSAEFVEKAKRVRQMFGGGMRQSGIMAAMALYALDHNIDRLADDHKIATMLGGRLAALPMVAKVKPVETNIVIFELRPEGPTAAQLVAAAEQDGFKIGAFGERIVRLVTHLDVTMKAAEDLIGALAPYLQQSTHDA